MSYLQMPKGIPNFSKAVISLWFRVPKQSIAKVKADALPHPVPFGVVFQGWIPLLTLGKPPVDNGMGPQVGDIASGAAVVIDKIGYAVDENYGGGVYDIEPFCIAVNCNKIESPVLVFNLQMSNKATGTNLSTSGAGTTTTDLRGMSNEQLAFWNTQLHTRGTGYGTATGPMEGTTTGFGDYGIIMSGITDFTDQSLTRPERFYVETVHEIEPDQWHHLLLSFDVSNPVNVRAPPVNTSLLPHPTFWDSVDQGVSSYCQLWYAVDDVDYRGPAPAETRKHHLGPYSVDYILAVDGGFSGVSPNGILTERAFDCVTEGSGDEYNLIVAPDTYSYTPESIPASENEFGLPASLKYVNHIYRVEMAEFQMWTGVTLDTGIESNRRAFIDYERDENGKPIVDAGGKNTLVPVSPESEAAEKLLGKKPEILLHGSSDWIEGKNTGTVGMDYSTDPPTVKSGGQFQPTGGINPYTPDPSLSKSGSPTRRKAGSVWLTKTPANARL